MARTVGKVLTATKVYFDSAHFNPSLLLTDKIYLPVTLTVDFGTHDTGVVGDLAAVGGTDVNVSETNGADCLQVQLDFSDVTSLNGFAFYGYYKGGAGHTLLVEIYDGAAWDVLGTQPEGTVKEWYHYNIYSPATYVIAGVVQVRFRHTSNGVNTHDLILDYAELNYGGAGVGGISAGAVTSTATGNVSSTNVQAAISELDTEKTDQAMVWAIMAVMG